MERQPEKKPDPPPDEPDFDKDEGLDKYDQEVAESFPASDPPASSQP